MTGTYKYKSYGWQLIITFILLLFSLDLYADQTHDQSLAFLVITDIHFDPYAACSKPFPCPLIHKLLHASPEEWPKLLSASTFKKAGKGQDTNWPLLQSTLIAAKQAAKVRQAKFVLVLGDFLTHDARAQFKLFSKENGNTAYQAFTKKTMQFLKIQLTHAFPGIKIYPVIGNNDSYQGDYFAEQNNRFFQDFTNIWGSSVRDSPSSIKQQYMRAGGYYATQLPSLLPLRLIVLNTTFFSEKAKGRNLSASSEQELKWLQGELERAQSKHQKAIIAMHIPMNVSWYFSKKIKLFTLTTLWHSAYIDRIQLITKKYADTLVGILSGHLHRNLFYLMSFNNDRNIPFVVTASVSPIFGNDPAFRIFYYDLLTQSLKNFSTFSMGTQGFQEETMSIWKN